MTFQSFQHHGQFASLVCSQDTWRLTGLGPDAVQLIYGGSGYQGTLNDIWIFNPGQRSWTRPSPTGEAPAGREMHCGCMVDKTTLLVYGGRATDGRWACSATDIS